MKKGIEHRIRDLKSKSFSEIDHLSILQNIYDEFQNGNRKFYLLARYFINGLDDLPNLNQKLLWTEEAFEQHRNLFYCSHDKLVEILDAYYDLEKDEELIQEFHPNKNLKSIWVEKNGLKNGTFKRYFDDTRLAYLCEYENGKSIGDVKEWYENGILAEVGKYANGEYFIQNFWDENGSQLLKDGTGIAIRKFGTNDNDVFEQYFENYHFKGEKKIRGVTYGKFEEKKNET